MSHISGDWKLDQSCRWLGIGIMPYTVHTRPRWTKGYMPAQISEKVVISSAARVIGRRYSALNTRRMADTKVPLWLMPIQKTIVAMNTPQKTGRRMPAMPMPQRIM